MTLDITSQAILELRLPYQDDCKKLSGGQDCKVTDGLSSGPVDIYWLSAAIPQATLETAETSLNTAPVLFTEKD